MRPKLEPPDEYPFLKSFFLSSEFIALDFESAALSVDFSAVTSGAAARPSERSLNFWVKTSLDALQGNGGKNQSRVSEMV